MGEGHRECHGEKTNREKKYDRRSHGLLSLPIDAAADKVPALLSASDERVNRLQGDMEIAFERHLLRARITATARAKVAKTFRVVGQGETFGRAAVSLEEE